MPFRPLVGGQVDLAIYEQRTQTRQYYVVRIYDAVLGHTRLTKNNDGLNPPNSQNTDFVIGMVSSLLKQTRHPAWTIMNYWPAYNTYTPVFIAAILLPTNRLCSSYGARRKSVSCPMQGAKWILQIAMQKYILKKSDSLMLKAFSSATVPIFGLLYREFTIFSGSGPSWYCNLWKCNNNCNNLCMVVPRQCRMLNLATTLHCCRW